MGGEIVGDALLQWGVGDEVGDAFGAAGVVEWHYYAVDAVAYLASGRVPKTSIIVFILLVLKIYHFTKLRTILRR